MCSAPDAIEGRNRTIELEYDLVQQAWVAWKLLDMHANCRTKELIFRLRDGSDSPAFQEALETLKSWGGRSERIFFVGDRQSVFPFVVYHLHDTPMVRELLDKFDTSRADRLTSQLNEIISEALKHGIDLLQLRADERRKSVGYFKLALGNVKFGREQPAPKYPATTRTARRRAQRETA